MHESELSNTLANALRTASVISRILNPVSAGVRHFANTMLLLSVVVPQKPLQLGPIEIRTTSDPPLKERVELGGLPLHENGLLGSVLLGSGSQWSPLQILHSPQSAT